MKALLLVGIVAIAALMLGLRSSNGDSAKTGPILPAPHGLYYVKGVSKLPEGAKLAMFSAGCFWGVEQEFRKQNGVLATAVGFTGGKVANPTYEQVCNHTTGHAETVLLAYDPSVVSYKDL